MKRRVLSIRMTIPGLESLKRRARDAGLSVSQFAERKLGECDDSATGVGSVANDVDASIDASIPNLRTASGIAA